MVDRRQNLTLKKQKFKDKKNPPQQQLLKLLAHYQNRRFGDAEKLATSITRKFSKHYFSWKVLGAVLKQTGRVSESLVASQKSVQLAPQNAEAHLNMGNTLKQLGRFDEAEESFKQAIALKPDYAEAHGNLGATLLELGRLDKAEESYRQAIALKPDYAGIHSLLGVTLHKLGRLDEAEASYTKAIELNPNIPESHQNLVELLTTYAPKKEILHPIVKVDQEIKGINLKKKSSGIISDDKIVQLFCKSSSIIKRHNLELGTDLSQIYRRNAVDLNCNRHMAIFNKFNIIPKFCFGCYKVQVEPRSILELIKLFVVFDQIKLVENNTRKCMLEIRPEISGFYKGLIYCSSLEEAYQIAGYLEIAVKENIGPGLHVVVKRGCSEYPLSFPDYKEINRPGPQLMSYNEDWKLIEEDHDSINSIKPNKIISPSLSGLNLSDVLIIRNWVDYAKGIGDSSVHLLNQNTVSSQRIYRVAKKRLETYPWR
jgi:Flp pilus assembly protein TadD